MKLQKPGGYVAFAFLGVLSEWDLPPRHGRLQAVD
jgi:hypothetical protein